MSIIIECRNKDADIKHENGDWTTVLGENITINSGDQLYIKNSFIDTQEATNQKINVSEDTTLTIEFGFYKLFRETFGMIGYNVAQPAIDYQNWLTCWKQNIPTPDPDNHYLYKQSRAVVFNQNVKNGTSQGCKVNYTYTDWEDNEKTGSFSIIPLSKQATFNINSIANIGSKGPIVFSPSVETLKSEFNVALELDFDNNLSDKNVANLLTYSKNIRIPKGAYEPDDICSLINDAMSLNNDPSGGYATEYGGILMGAHQIMETRFSAGGAKTNDLILVGDVASLQEYDSSNQYPAGDDIWVGSNQFEISYDQATKKFAFNMLHFPYYYQKSLSVEYGQGGPQGTYVVNKNGGLWIKHLSRLEGDDLWTEFGFPPEHQSIYPTFQWSERADPVDGKVLITPYADLQDTVTITGSATTVDAVVAKDDGKQNRVWAVQPINSTVAIADNNSIEGQTSILDKADNFGYFIVEIGHKLKNEFYTPNNNYRNFQQIVSKYFVQNSYTTGSSDGSLIYTHNGQPTLLESFQCRILNSDKDLAENIGEDNTVHIVLVRAEKSEK